MVTFNYRRGRFLKDLTVYREEYVWNVPRPAILAALFTKTGSRVKLSTRLDFIRQVELTGGPKGRVYISPCRYRRNDSRLHDL